jgi:hypothetical protein
MCDSTCSRLLFYLSLFFFLGGFMASGAKNQLRLVNVLGAPTLRDGSVGRWDGKERFFSRWFYRWWAPVSSDSSKCALPDHFSTRNRDQSPLIGSGLHMLVLLAVLVGSMQPNMASRAQDHPGSDPGVFPFWPFWSTWRTLRSSIPEPKRPRRSFPSAVTHLESESMTPSAVIRPRVVSVQVPQVADFAFCPIVGHATAVAYNKIW